MRNSNEILSQDLAVAIIHSTNRTTATVTFCNVSVEIDRKSYDVNLGNVYDVKVGGAISPGKT